jgi:hypothetical protein
MKEPAVAFLLSADFDNGSCIPIGVAVLSQFMNAIDDAIQDTAVPPTRLAAAAARWVAKPAVDLQGIFASRPT